MPSPVPCVGVASVVAIVAVVVVVVVVAVAVAVAAVVFYCWAHRFVDNRGTRRLMTFVVRFHSRFSSLKASEKVLKIAEQQAQRTLQRQV